MRKKFVSTMMAVLVACSMFACGKAETADAPAETAAAPTASEETAVSDPAETVETAEAAETTEDSECLIAPGEESERLLYYRENGFRYGYCDDIPYEYLDENGNLAGFEVEIVTEALNRLGIYDIIPVYTSWDTYATELQQGKFDIFGCGVYVTDERLEVMNMCNMTYNLKECIVVRADSDIYTVEDLADKSVGSSVGMLYMDVTQQAAEDGIFGSAVEGGQPSALALDVQTGKIDAAMMDIVMGGYLTSQENMDNLRVLEDWENLTDGYCSYLFGINDTEFVREFNVALDSMKEDGTMEAILEPYGMASAVVPVDEGQVVLPR